MGNCGALFVVAGVDLLAIPIRTSLSPGLIIETPRCLRQHALEPHFIVCCNEEGSSSKIHSTTEIGRLPFLIRSS